MRPTTKKNLLIAATYAVVLFLGLLLGQNFADENERSGHNSLLPLGLSDKTTKLQRVLHLINEYYVDSVNIDTMQRMAISDIVSRLDPHSAYLPPERARLLNEDLQGSFEGIGVEYYSINDTLLVSGLTLNGPAEKGGLHLGDKLIQVNGEPIAGSHLSAKDIAAKVRGSRGTKVQIWIKRKGVELDKPLTIIRDKIKVSSIDAAYVIDTATAYVKIKRFGAQTADDFTSALTLMKKQGAEKLILDLRENGGGYLTAATALASQFLHAKQLIVYTKGAHHNRTDYYSSAPGLFRTGELVVLIDGQSASASEIVAGAIQDLKRGIVIGQPSFGKGLIQEQFEFGDGSALNLTIARYYTPSGRCIQKSYHSINGDYRAITASNTQQETPWPLHDGGINPDIYVYADTIANNAFYRSLFEKGLITDFVFSNLIDEIPSFSAEHFITHYQLPKGCYRKFLRFAKARGVLIDNKASRLSQKLVESDMKALLGKYFFGGPVFFRIKNMTDPDLIKSLEVMRSQN